MFDLGERVRKKTTAEEGAVIEFLRPGDRHPETGAIVPNGRSYSFVLYGDPPGNGEWLRDDLLEGV